MKEMRDTKKIRVEDLKRLMADLDYRRKYFYTIIESICKHGAADDIKAAGELALNLAEFTLWAAETLAENDHEDDLVPIPQKGILAAMLVIADPKLNESVEDFKKTTGGFRHEQGI